ncbi:hypothetical protein [Flavobacterium gelatinilyticum]|uniref:hypothetical protein n=1 Tax=Flavobacterium gelatinilyticum TaxID=3003260 RepID=UPI00247FD473|nr:hypothetical protein [Flavobacterium gelatinilyticum]
MNKTTNFYTVAVLFLSVLFFSCDTEYVDKVNEIPGDVIKVPGYTQIESFIVKDKENNPISAAITENNLVITWSNYMELPETVKPEIILGQEAAISPASGAEVPFKDGTEFIVTSKAGTTKKYTLKIDFRQREPKAWSYAGSDFLYKGQLQKVVNSGLDGEIDNLWLSLKDTQVILVAASDQKEYAAETVYVGTGIGAAPYLNYGVYYFLPENLPVGLYDLRIKNGAYTLQNANVEERFKIEAAEPDFYKTEKYGFPATKKAGETIEVRGSLLDLLQSVSIYSNNDPSVVYPLEIVSLTKYRAVLRIPAGTPAGTYERMRFTREDATSNLTYPVTVE